MLKIDQINKLNAMQGEIDELKSRLDSIDDIEDEVEDILILAYIYGNESAEDMLGKKNELDTDNVEEALSKTYGGRSVEDILREHIENGDFAGIKRVIDTETHRMYNEGVLAGGKGIAHNKTWDTMEDMKVRDTHEYLQGRTIPYNEYFYTYDGDRARYPGDFEEAENNVNCRCWLTLS